MLVLSVTINLRRRRNVSKFVLMQRRVFGTERRILYSLSDWKIQDECVGRLRVLSCKFEHNDYWSYYPFSMSL